MSGGPYIDESSRFQTNRRLFTSPTMIITTNLYKSSGQYIIGRTRYESTGWV